jgi:hypothetical protein
VGPPGLYAEGFNTANPNILKLDLISGEAWTNDPNRSGVVLSASIADTTGKAVGDSIGLTVSGNTRSFEIIGVAQSTTDVVWMNWAQLSAFGGLVIADGKPYRTRSTSRWLRRIPARAKSMMLSALSTMSCSPMAFQPGTTTRSRLPT